MYETGVVRSVDALGRIVIPMEFRRTLGIGVRDPLSISVDGERIVISRHHDACVMCGSMDDILRLRDRAICPECVAAVKLM